MPEKYDGNPDHCRAFLKQCGLYIEEHPKRFTDETARIRFVISLLTDHTRDWATALWTDNSPLLESARDFQAAFKEIFNHPSVGCSLGECLVDLLQRSQTVVEFSLEFKTRSPLTPTKRRHRIVQGLCVYCGKPVHTLHSCPIRPS